MREYPKINSVFKRDPETGNRHFLMWDWADPIFEYLKDCEWVATEKVDGTNCRIEIAGDTPEHKLDPALRRGWRIGGRTDNAQMPIKLQQVLDGVGESAVGKDLGELTLFGEGYGAGIQKGGIYRDSPGFILFDVYAESQDLWLERENVVDIANKLGVDVVPYTYLGTLGQAIWMFENHRPVALRSELTGKDNSEGWVLRPARELKDRRGNRVITKIKNRDFR